MAMPIVVETRIFVYDRTNERGGSRRRRGHLISAVLEHLTFRIFRRIRGSKRRVLIGAGRHASQSGQMGPRHPYERRGYEVVVEATELIACMLQHKTAHLDGVLRAEQLDWPYSAKARHVVASKGGGCGVVLEAGKDRISSLARASTRRTRCCVVRSGFRARSASHIRGCRGDLCASLLGHIRMRHELCCGFDTYTSVVPFRGVHRRQDRTLPASQMPISCGGLVLTRSVVLPIQPLAGFVHHGSNGRSPLYLLHLSWPGFTDSG